MLIFKIYIILFSLAFSRTGALKINSNDSIIVNEEVNKYFSEDEKLSTIYRLDSYDYDKTETIFKIIDTKKNIDSLIIIYNYDINKNIVQKILRPYQNTPIDENYRGIGPELVSRYYFLKINPRYQFGLINNTVLGAKILFKPDFESNYSGIVGMSKIEKRWSLNGELNIILENFFKNTENINLYWKKIDSLSQVINLDFMIPHPFGWDTGISIKHHYELFSGLYTFIEHRYSIITFLPYLGNAGIGYLKGKTFPTKEGINNGYSKLSYLAISAFSKKDNTNARILPTSGRIMDLEIDGGIEDKFNFINYKFFYKRFYPLSKLFYFTIKLNVKGIKYFNGSIPKSRYLSFGGASSLRGYDEQQFLSTQYQISSMELCYKPLKSFEMIFFLDIASNQLNILEHNWPGWGFGITQVNDNTIIKLGYGLSSFSFENGKLHIKWISRF